MKTLARVALCALLIAGCGKGTRGVDELRAQVDDLTHRVKVLEDDLLKANKQLIQHKQAMQQMHEEMQNINNYFDKIQAGQSSVPR
jgi:outer membrane murein-binding lipoprotein Lpp